MAGRTRPPSTDPSDADASKQPLVPDAERTDRARSKTVGHYLLGPTLGEGTFGKVKLGTHVLTGEKVAIKLLEKSKIKEVADVERVSREINILKRIRHRNVIQLFEVIDTPKQIFLVMEYSDGGELFDYIVKHKRVPEPQAAAFMQDICAGLDYLHTVNVVHRDLKPENLLMHRTSSGWAIKVIDFGLSNTCDGGRLLKTACGSPCYAAPEMIAGHKYVGSATDMWSLGVVLFALVCGYLPFEHENTAKLYQKILNGDYTTPEFISSQVKDLIRHILETNPRKRYTMEEVRRHPWFRQATPSITSTIRVIPASYAEISSAVMKHVARLGLDVRHVADSVIRNAHNHASTTYYLLAERLLREGQPLFDKSDSFSWYPEGGLGLTAPLTSPPGGDEKQLAQQQLQQQSHHGPLPHSAPVKSLQFHATQPQQQQQVLPHPSGIPIPDNTSAVRSPRVEGDSVIIASRGGVQSLQQPASGSTSSEDNTHARRGPVSPRQSIHVHPSQQQHQAYSQPTPSAQTHSQQVHAQQLQQQQQDQPYARRSPRSRSPRPSRVDDDMKRDVVAVYGPPRERPITSAFQKAGSPRTKIVVPHDSAPASNQPQSTGSGETPVPSFAVYYQHPGTSHVRGRVSVHEAVPNRSPRVHSSLSRPVRERNRRVSSVSPRNVPPRASSVASNDRPTKPGSHGQDPPTVPSSDTKAQRAALIYTSYRPTSSYWPPQGGSGPRQGSSGSGGPVVVPRIGRAPTPPVQKDEGSPRGPTVVHPAVIAASGSGNTTVPHAPNTAHGGVPGSRPMSTYGVRLGPLSSPDTGGTDTVIPPSSKDSSQSGNGQKMWGGRRIKETTATVPHSATTGVVEPDNTVLEDVVDSPTPAKVPKVPSKPAGGDSTYTGRFGRFSFASSTGNTPSVPTHV